MSSAEDPAVVTHRRMTNVFIGLGVAVGAGLLWAANGMPGVPLRDGDYGCRSGDSALSRPGPGVTVEGGEVVDVWDYDIRAGRKVSLEWSDAKREGPKTLSVTSEDPNIPGQSQSWVCKNS